MQIEQVTVEWTGGEGRIDRAIQAVDRTPYGPSRINHTLLAFKFRDGPHIISQSRFKKGVHLCAYSTLEDAKRRGVVTQHIVHELDVTPEEADILWQEATWHYGPGYDNGQILCYLAWLKLRPHRPRPVFKRRNAVRTCNEHVQDTLVRVRPGLAERELTPTRLCWVLTGQWPVREGGM